jgi:hypothetical protein
VDRASIRTLSEASVLASVQDTIRFVFKNQWTLLSCSRIALLELLLALAPQSSGKGLPAVGRSRPGVSFCVHKIDSFSNGLTLGLVVSLMAPEGKHQHRKFAGGGDDGFLFGSPSSAFNES